MPKSKKDPPLPATGAPPPDDAPPSGDVDAPLPPDSGTLPVDDPPVRDAGAPEHEEDTGEPVTRALTDAFLAKKATQDRIRQVAVARAPTGTQESDIDELVQMANERAMETTSLARSVSSMRPWVSRLTQNIVIDHYKADARRLKWLDPSVDVQELPPDPADESDEVAVPADDPTAPPRPMGWVERGGLERFLDANVKTPADRLTLEMIRFKARSGKTNAEVAKEFGMSEDAFDARLARFKAKWIPQWKESDERRQLMILLWILRGVLLLAVGVTIYFLVPWHKAEPIGPTTVPELQPAPSASAAPPDQFNQALPPDDGKPGPK
ncbi:MAG TPA: hypothetical protein VIF09_12315 [Polyangiaceae bacterium]|jgi:DNA-directed RNA polymerase specialized sigma24 family protein